MCNLRNVMSALLGILSAGLLLVALLLAWQARDDVPILVDEPNQFIGKVKATEKLGLQVVMRNRGRHLVRILGDNGRCSLHGCFYATNMPLEIGAGDSKVIDVSFKATDETGRFVYPLTFYTDAPQQAEVTISFEGVVVKGSKNTSAVAK
jgi:hypothetical protein